MSKFVISAVMDEDKNLTVKSAAMQNQGESGSAQLTVSVPAEWAEKEFYAEFLCPHDRRFVSPQMQKASSGNSFSCTLPACVLQEEGFVGFQLIVRNPADGTVFKSNYSKRSSFFVNASVNADKDVVAVMDFFSEAKQLVAQTEEKAQSAVERVQKAVLHTDQTLTEEQKRQARENIGAGTSSFGGSYDDLTDKPVIPQVPQDIVKYSQQTLTEEQKQQARENIGAGTSSFSGSYDDLTDKPVIPQVPQDIVKYSQQTLTEEQKQQARENIGAGTSSFSGSYDELTDKPELPSTWVTSVGGLTGKVNIGKGITTSGTSLVTSQYADLTSYRLAANEFARIDDMCHGSLDLLTYGNALTDGKLTFRKRGANDYEDVYVNIPQNAQYTVMKVLIFLRAFIIRGTFYTEGYEKIQDFDLMIDYGLKYFGIGVTTEESYDSVVYAIRQLSLS